MDDLKSWQVRQSEAYKVYIKTSAAGLEFGLSIVIGTLLGYLADKYFQSSPWGLIIGMIVGCIAAAKRIYIFVKNYLEKDENDDNK